MRTFDLVLRVQGSESAMGVDCFKAWNSGSSSIEANPEPEKP